MLISKLKGHILRRQLRFSVADKFISVLPLTNFVVLEFISVSAAYIALLMQQQQ